MASSPTTVFDLDRGALAALVEGEPLYRVEQIWTGLYRQLTPVVEISNLPASLRNDLADRAPEALTEMTRSTTDAGDTVKFLWSLHDGATVETVLMYSPDRVTVCISTQAGCAMNCSFCATGQAGFERQLSVGEIVEQVIRAAREATPRRVSNVVFMGMGEPLANLDATIAAAHRFHHDLGISARQLTISTVGLIPGIRRLADEPLPVTLAVSLHAARDQLRNELVPINQRYPLRDLAAACREYFDAKGRRLSFEWAMIANVNDTPRDLDELARYARDLRAHVNLIPLNPTPGYPVIGTTADDVRQFCQGLIAAGVNATVRRTRGTDIDAACGQLRTAHQPSATSHRRPSDRVPVQLRARNDSDQNG